MTLVALLLLLTLAHVAPGRAASDDTSTTEELTTSETSTTEELTSSDTTSETSSFSLCETASDCQEADPMHACDWECDQGECIKGECDHALCPDRDPMDCVKTECIEGACIELSKPNDAPCASDGCDEGLCNNGVCICITAPPTPAPTPGDEEAVCCLPEWDQFDEFCEVTSPTDCAEREGLYYPWLTACDHSAREFCGLGCCSSETQCIPQVTRAFCALHGGAEPTFSQGVDCCDVPACVSLISCPTAPPTTGPPTTTTQAPTPAPTTEPPVTDTPTPAPTTGTTEPPVTDTPTPAPTTGTTEPPVTDTPTPAPTTGTTEPPITDTPTPAPTTGTTEPTTTPAPTTGTTEPPVTDTPTPAPTTGTTEPPTTPAPTTGTTEPPTTGTTEPPVTDTPTPAPTTGTTEPPVTDTPTPAPTTGTTEPPVTDTPTPAPTTGSTEPPVTDTPTPAPTTGTTEPPVTDTPTPAPTTGTTEPPVTDTPTPAPTGPPCTEERLCGERPGCVGGLHDGLICRTLADCVGGSRCVPIEEACHDEAPCNDCNLDEDDMRAHRCAPCRYCTVEELENEPSNADSLWNHIGCCPEPVAPTPMPTTTTMMSTVTTTTTTTTLAPTTTTTTTTLAPTTTTTTTAAPTTTTTTTTPMPTTTTTMATTTTVSMGGICCGSLNIDACILVNSPSECSSSFGSFVAGGTSCEQCAEELRACCREDPVCDLRTPAACGMLGGAVAQGNNCSTANCARGACCSVNSCRDNVAGVVCSDPQTQFFAPGQQCDTLQCPLFGACCLRDAEIDSCVNMRADLCTGQVGSYQGDGTTCFEGLCAPAPPTGACCLAVPDVGVVCEHPQTEVQCVSAGGTWNGPDSMCLEDACSQQLLRHRPQRHTVRTCPTPAPTPVPSGPPSYGSSCRPKLGCMCVNCVDQCDFSLDQPRLMPPLCLGDAQGSFGRLGTVLFPEVIGDDCITPHIAASGTCMALRNRSCELFPDHQRNGTIEPRTALTVDDVTDSINYATKQHDVYRFYTTDVRVTIKLSSLGAISATATANQALPVIYLIPTGSNCSTPTVISPRTALYSSPIAVATEMSFDIPCPGEYLVVLSMVLSNQAADLSGLLTEAQRAAARCVHYGITLVPEPNICPERICNLPGCHDSRDCEQTRSCNACDPASHRCIVGVAVDACSGQLPLADPCADAADGVGCIASLIATELTDDDDSNNGLIRCATGTCQSRVCVVGSFEQGVFQCQCTCAAQCVHDNECNDGNPATLDRCFEGTCVSRPYPGGETPTSPCNKYSDLDESAQPITAPCGTEHDPALAAILDGDTDRTVVVVITTSPQSAPETAQVLCAQGAVGIDCEVTLTPVCVRLVGNEHVQFQCTEPPTPLSLAHSRVAQLSAGECAVRALDAAEIAHATASFDMFGAFDASSQRTTPLCGTDIEASRVAVDVETHGVRLDACCSADLPALSRTCLDGARYAHATGHEWLDRAWLALDRAARHSQRGATVDAQRESCCSALFYAAVAAACGRRGDKHQLGATPRVVRTDAAPGAQCVLFDDGHVDGDLNDWVAEQRIVEIYDSHQRLRAINVHVLPLARGGGYKAAYVLSARGSALRALERSATAACSARTRALMREAYDQTQVGALLRSRSGVPERSFVAVSRHALGADGRLPVGVRHTDCATVGSAGDETAFCPVATDAIALIGDLRSALPLGANDTLERLLSAGAKFDQSTNTQPHTRRQRAQFAVSATVALPRRGSVGSGSGELRFALINEDCAAAVVLPPDDESVPAEPMALTVPASACAAWRWAAEGHKLVQSAYATDRTCRGGDNGGIEQCSSDNGVCTTSGGVCAESPRSEGVPYQYAYEHYAVCTECRTTRQCNEDVACFGRRCCSEQVLQWYKYPTIEHLFVPRDIVVGVESEK